MGISKSHERERREDETGIPGFHDCRAVLLYRGKHFDFLPIHF